jgi:hypothetical protein
MRRRPRPPRGAPCPTCFAPALCLLGPLLAAADTPPAVEPSLPAAAATSVYDPTRGLDPNGRIPKVALPADLHRPDRWRYTPEGRIAPGTFLARFFVTSFASPIFYYEEDVGAGGGVALTDIDFRHQRRREFLGAFASRSTEGQENYAVVWRRLLDHRDLPAGGVITEERGWLRAIVGYERTRTRRFFGFGGDARESAETSYTDESGFANLLVQRALPLPGDDLVVSAGARVEHHNLTRGRVRERPSTGDAFPDIVAAGDSHDAGWVTLGLRWDTRDSQHNPYRGGFLGATIDAAPLQSDGEQGAIGELRGGLAVPLPSLFHDGGDPGEENPPTDALVIGAFVQDAAGDLPFWALPSLGGPNTLRGYIANRFTGRAAWHAAAEWRTWPIPRGVRFTDAIRLERLGFALFYELGSVAEDVRELDAATVHDSYGVGFRLGFERTAVFRVDLGFSGEDSAVTAAFGTSL